MKWFLILWLTSKKVSVHDMQSQQHCMETGGYVRRITNYKVRYRCTQVPPSEALNLKGADAGAGNIRAPRAPTHATN